MLTPQATYKAFVAWDRRATGYFRIGRSKIGGPDGLAPVAFADVFGGQYDELGVVERISINGRGRTRRLGPVQAATGSISARDDDGRMNSLKTASPLYGKVKPLRPIRIEGTSIPTGIKYPLFFGFLRDGDEQARGKTSVATFQLVDPLVWLDAIKVDDVIAAPTTVGTQIGVWLNLAGWSDPKMRSLDLGSEIPARASTGKRAITTLIKELLEIDLGRFYFSAAGVATYRARNAWVTQPFSGRIADGMIAMGSGFTLDNVKNRISVTGAAGGEQVIVDQASADEYGTRDADTIVSNLIANAAQASSYGRYRLSLDKDPETPVWALRIRNSTAALLEHALARDFGDWIQAANSVTGTDRDFVIEQVNHEIDGAKKRHDASYLLSLRPTKIPLKISRGKIGRNSLTY